MKILSAKQVSELTSLSIPQIRRMASAGTMPRPVRISGSRVGWVQHDIEAWIKQLLKPKIRRQVMHLKSMTAADFVGLKYRQDNMCFHLCLLAATKFTLEQV